MAKSRNPLLIGSTVLTKDFTKEYTYGAILSQSPPNRVNGSHKIGYEKNRTWLFSVAIPS